MIHGGGHIMLSRKDIRPEQTALLLRSGFLPISVDYRLCPETTLLAGPMADVADALSWARTVLPRTQLARPDVIVDPERVVAVGWSTGGHLAMTLGWTTPQPPSAILALYCPTDYEDGFWTKPNVPDGVDAASFAGDDDDEEEAGIWEAVFDVPVTAYNVAAGKRAVGGWLARDDARSRLAQLMNVRGLTLPVLLHGLDKKTETKGEFKLAMPSPDLVARASPLAQIRAGRYGSPTFIVHPRQDDLIPWQQAERTWLALREAGVDAELRVVEDVPHLFDLSPRHPGYRAAMAAVEEGYAFLCRHAGLEWRE
jgi:acetyl esterase/lipase